MAGGGVGEAMLIGAAVGAGTGGVMSAVKDEDPLQGALLGAAMGAAGGGIGSWAGGALGGEAGGLAGGEAGGIGGGGSGAATTAATQAPTATAGLFGGPVPGAESAIGQYAGTSGIATGTTGSAAGTTPGALSFGAGPAPQAAGQVGTFASQTSPNWASQGLGQGFAPALTNAQAYGAGVGGGIMGLVGQNAQNQNNMAQEPETYTGPLSQFKYSPNTFRPSVAPGYADGGVASLGRQAGMYPQSQYDKTQFAVPSQMPISREVIGSDYDARISPYTGDMMMASGGISSLGSYSDGGRMLRGPGDGMSDDIPGVIAGKQPARLADGEFVVPADVVSHLGNGSTDAGAKKLYSMMDNVRKARTGTKKQGKQIKAEKHMPMAKGGRVENGMQRFDGGGGAWTDPYLVPTTQGGFLDVGNTNGVSADQVQAMIDASRKGTAGISNEFQPTGYQPSQQYTPYTMANRPSSTAPQYYQDIYQGAYPDYSTPGYTLAGNLGRWSNVAGEQARAAQPASRAQLTTQAYLQNLGRAPDTEGFNYWMQPEHGAAAIQQGIAASPEAYGAGQTNKADYISRLYQQYLGRAPEEAGMNYWSGQLGNQMNVEQVAQAIKGSEEAKARQAPKEEKKRRGGIASLYRA